jgi:3-phenylpropionate/trans-cinnamate dioxygenase ferredoxin reductase subunit
VSAAPTLVVLGASLAGAKAAESARAAGHDGRIVLVGEERAAPYERPLLSKDVLRGDKGPESVRVHPDGFYAEHRIELVTERAVALDTINRAVELAGGDRIAFDSLVIATGAEPRRLTVAGADLDGVHHLRTIDDAVRLRDAIRSASRVAIIGAGWIGSEVAASAREMGADVVLIDRGSVPLQRVLGPQLGAVFAQLHAEHGVQLRPGATVAELRGTKCVEAVVLEDGRVEPADVVVVGIGVTPRTELADAAIGMRVEDGIRVDRRLATNVDRVYAAGDVANAWHPRYRRHLRVEHWANALHQGLVAGRNAAGARDVYDRLPFFYSDQYDVGLEYVGHGDVNDAVAVRGDLDARKLVAFWHRDGHVTAAMHLNVWDVTSHLERIVGSSQRVDPQRLADPDVPLTELV